MVVYFNCTNLTSTEFGHLSLARGITAIILLFFVYHTFLYIAFTYKTSLASFQQRVFFYLTISTIFYLAILSGDIEHHFSFKSPNDAACKAMGFLVQYAGSVQLVYTLEIVLVLVYTMKNVCCYDNAAQKLNQKNCLEAIISIPCCPDKKFKCKHFLEAFMIFSIPWILPLPFAFMPFASTFVPYGETGPWCWIQSRHEDCSAKGQVEEVLMWYVPFGVAGVFGALCVFAAIIIFLCLLSKHQAEKFTIFCGEFLLLLIFLIAYVCLFAIEVGCRHKAIGRDKYNMWMVYAISTPLSAICIPIAFLAYSARMRYKRKHKQQHNQEDGDGEVNQEDGDGEVNQEDGGGEVNQEDGDGENDAQEGLTMLSDLTTDCVHCLTKSGETTVNGETEPLLNNKHAAHTA